MFNHVITFFCFLTILIPEASQAQLTGDSCFDKRSLKNIVSVLASDSFKGRGNFTPELEKAASYISRLFRKAGLNTLFGSDNYEIPFIVDENSFKSFEELIINDKKINAGEYFFQSAYYIPQPLQLNDFVVIPLTENKEDPIGIINKYIDSINAPILIKIPGKFLSILKSIINKSGKVKTPYHSLLIISEDELLRNVTVRLNPAVRKKMLFNIGGRLAGTRTPDKTIIFSAHYDHMGIVSSAESGDEIYNGANDNASGTAAMLAFMQHYAHEKSNDVSLVFIAFAGEELGLEGSMVLSRYFNKKNTIAVINLEMLGKEDERGTGVLTLTDYEKSTIGRIMKKYCTDIRILPDNHPNEQLALRSDNFPFHLNGIIATTMMCFAANDPTYHTSKDETYTLNFDNMSTLLKGMLPGLNAMISGKEVPVSNN